MLKQISNRILNKKFIYSCIIVFCTGFFSRYLILIYLDVNVFTDIFNKISIFYYAVMSVHIRLVGEIINESLKPSEIMMSTSTSVGGNPPMGSANAPAPAPAGSANAPVGGGGAANPPAGQGANNTGIDGTLKANRINGAIVVDDPYDQKHEYVPGGTNQPYCRNFGRTLNHQRQIGSPGFSRFMFTDTQARYFLSFLKDQHPELHDRFFRDKQGNRTDKPVWYTIPNTKKFTDTFEKPK